MITIKKNRQTFLLAGGILGLLLCPIVLTNGSNGEQVNDGHTEKSGDERFAGSHSFIPRSAAIASSAAAAEALITKIDEGMTREEVEEILGNAWRESLLLAFNSLESITYKHQDFSDPQIRIDYRWAEWRVVSVPDDAPNQIFPGIGIETSGPLTVSADPILVRSQGKHNEPGTPDTESEFPLEERELPLDELEMLVERRLDEIIEARDVAAWRSLRNELEGLVFLAFERGVEIGVSPQEISRDRTLQARYGTLNVDLLSHERTIRHREIDYDVVATIRQRLRNMIRGYPVLLTADWLESRMLLGIGARYLAFDEEAVSDLLWSRFVELKDEEPEQAAPLAILLHLLPDDLKPSKLPKVSDLVFVDDPRPPARILDRAKDRYPHGICLLGLARMREETDQSIQEARELFERAAFLGHREAQIELGLMHIKGKGGPSDKLSGFAWLKLAGDLLPVAARRALDNLEKEFTDEEMEAALTLYEELRVKVSHGGGTLEREATYKRRVFDLAREYVDLILQGEHLRAAELTCADDLNEFRELWLSQFDRPAVVSDETLGEHFFGERSVLEEMTPAAAYAHWTEKMVEGFPSVTEGTPDATVQDVGRDAEDSQIWHALVEWINVNDIRILAATVEIKEEDDELCVKIPGSLFRIWK